MKLLFNYLPYSMKDSDTVVRSKKKANSKEAPTNDNGISNTKITKFFSSFYSSNKAGDTSATSTTTTSITKNSNNGTPKKTKSSKKNDEAAKKRGRPRKHDVAIGKMLTNGNKLKKRSSITSQAPSSVSSDSSASSSSSTSSSVTTVVATNGRSTPKKRGRKAKSMATKKKGSNKSSPKLRPRRRASQTYFFKYQLARNPLKAEEEDLKQALIASLQHCSDEQVKCAGSEQQEHVENNHNHNNNKQPKKENHGNLQQPSKQQRTKHPPPKQSAHQETVILQQPTPPVYDEEYLKRYRPETEDFLTFICFRVTAPNFPSAKHIELSGPTATGSIDHLSNLNINDGPLNGCTTSTGINVKISNDKTSNDYHNLRRSTSPCKSSASNQTASNSSPNHLYSPSNRRRPTRQSPRLASSSRKISEIDSLNHYTAYDNQITYEEDIKRAQIALEDMAHEINGSEIDEPIAQSGHRQNSQQHQHASSKMNSEAGCVSPNPKLLSPFKNNKHLVKGLMTREFAGAFADEEIIFESIKNHKL